MKIIKESVLYLLFGVLTTLVNIITYYIFSNIVDVNYLASNSIAWILSVAFAYVTNRKFVFNSPNNLPNEIIKELLAFTSCRVITGVVDLFIMFIGIDIIEINDLKIKIIANFLVIIMNFIFSKLFIFKKVVNVRSI